MIDFNRPDVLNSAIKIILKHAYPVSEGTEWKEQDTVSWKEFCYNFGIKNGEGGHPEYGLMPPLLRYWLNTLSNEIVENSDKYGLAKVNEPKNKPNPMNVLPNVGDGEPQVEFDKNDNPVYKSTDGEGNPVSVSQSDQNKMKQILAGSGKQEPPKTEPNKSNDVKSDRVSNTQNNENKTVTTRKG